MPAAACRLAAALLAAALFAPAAGADGLRRAPLVAFADFSRACGGECRVTVFAGRFLDTNMTDVLLPFDEDFALPWDWRFRDAHMLSLAVSRRLATIGGVFDIEAEAGFGQRFGEEHAAEGWVALYGRWTRFPWNHRLRTTFAVSTGLDYASRVTRAELDRTAFGTGNRLLHYFSPEITVADPDWRRTELVLRFHHRSGGGKVWGDSLLFGGVAEGAQYLKIGLRHRF